MAEKRQKQPTHTSPSGIAVFPWLTKPDTKFETTPGGKGDYRVKLALEGKDAADLEAFLEQQRQAWIAEVQAEKGKKKVKVLDPPYAPKLDDEDEPTGITLFSFKRKAGGISKKTGKPWDAIIPIYDAAGNRIADTDNLKLWGGSRIKVAFSINPFATALGTGISLRIEAIQVLELAESDRDASSYGFGKEDGYEAPKGDTFGGPPAGDEESGEADF